MVKIALWGKNHRTRLGAQAISSKKTHEEEGKKKYNGEIGSLG